VIKLEEESKPIASEFNRLGSMLSGRSNAFNFLRLLFAITVIVDHAFPLGGFGEDPMWKWSKNQDSLGGIAVAGFFAISGYLITKSSMSSDFVQFLWRRILRIFPAYWVVLLVTSGVLAPILWSLEAKEWSNFSGSGVCSPARYVVANWFLEIGQYCIGDLFSETTPYGKQVKASVFNGSLWTLIFEWRCYLLVGVLGLFGVLHKYKLLVVTITFWFYLMLLIQTVMPDFPGKAVFWLDGVQSIHTIRFTCIFMIGATAALYADRLPVDDRVGILSGLSFIYSLLNGGYYAIGYPCLVYFVLWLAIRLPDGLKKIGAKNDYSYGIYIYGFLIQQILAYFNFNVYGLWIYILSAMLLSYFCAVASWHFIEKPALSLKRVGPGRGVEYWRRNFATLVNF
jgi:peptidoglycan/LPS O-acetylase OafA/YrhL